MEKVTVRIQRSTTKSSDAMLFRFVRSDDVSFLKSAFEISHKRADNLIKSLEKDFESCGGATESIIVDLNYRQLARYTAKRQVEGLNKYWKYPLVLEHIEDTNFDAVPKSIELRPSFRRTY